MGTPDINKSSLKTNQKTVTNSGTPVALGGYMIAATVAFVVASRHITDSANGFLNAGIEVGDTITVKGSASNDGVYTVSTIAAGTITLITGTVLVTENAGQTITISESGVGFPIDDGIRAVVKAMHNNTGFISIGGNSTDALAAGTDHVRLYADQSLEMRVDNLQKIWIDASVSGEGVELIYEF